MAPIEFEKQIKERLEARKIKPSKNAWNRISDQLEPGKAQPKPRYYRYAIAAAVVGVVLAVIWINSISDPKTMEMTPAIVEEAPDVPAEENNTRIDQEMEDNNTMVADFEEGNKGDDNGSEVIRDMHKSDHLIIADKTNPSNHKDQTRDADLIIDEKITELVAQVELMEENREAVTEAEVDSLLRNAQRELLADKQFNESNRVDASALLAGVEDELNKSFRDQVFEKLKNGFIKVRTAVADRNN